MLLTQSLEVFHLSIEPIFAIFIVSRPLTVAELLS